MITGRPPGDDARQGSDLADFRVRSPIVILFGNPTPKSPILTGGQDDVLARYDDWHLWFREPVRVFGRVGAGFGEGVPIRGRRGGWDSMKTSYY